MVATLYVFSALMLQQATTSWDLRSMLHSMSTLALVVVVILFILSIYSSDVIDAAKRGLERSVAIVHAEMKRGLSALATIGSTAPFVGLFGTVVGILNAFKGIEQNKATGLSAVAGGIAEALVTTAFGLLVAVPAVWAYNYFTNKVEAFDVEMDNSSMELINYFILRRGAKK